MSASPWACAALLCWHLNFAGALPREVPVDDIRGYATQHQVRVLIFDQADVVYLRPTCSLAIKNYDTQTPLALAPKGALITLRRSGSVLTIRGPGVRASARRVLTEPLSQDNAAAISSNGGWGSKGSYSGMLDIVATPTGLRVVEHVGLEHYIAGVVAAEMPSSFPPEALKAQAIAARTYALYHLGAHADADADLCGRVHCQAYHGRPPAGSPAAQAASRTAGQVVSWNGILIDALYHSACGGATAAAWQVRQGKLLPYLRGYPDTPSALLHSSPYCGRDHELSWTTRIPGWKAQRLVSSNLGRVLGQPGLMPGRLQSLRVESTTDYGRANWLEITTTKDTYRVRGDAIRWLFGAGYPGPTGLRSTSFQLTSEGESQGRPAFFDFHGVGYGHGIGLCQWGARGRALAGQTAHEILAAYYPGATVITLGDE